MRKYDVIKMAIKKMTNNRGVIIKININFAAQKLSIYHL